MAAHSSIPAWRIPWTEESGGCSSWGAKDLDTTEQQSTISTIGYIALYCNRFIILCTEMIHF